MHISNTKGKCEHTDVVSAWWSRVVDTMFARLGIGAKLRVARGVQCTDGMDGGCCMSNLVDTCDFGTRSVWIVRVMRSGSVPRNVLEV